MRYRVRKQSRSSHPGASRCARRSRENYFAAIAPLVLVAAVAIGSDAIGAPRERPAPDTSLQSYPPARFGDPDRVTRLKAAVSELDRIFREWQVAAPAPGAAYGLVIDGQLVHSAAFGYRDGAAQEPADADSVFRIASMTKSFTAAAILRLRDDGRLRLDDPVDKYVPELAHLAYPTTDSPRLTIRHLLSHSSGFPEDNPWGDRQLALSPSTMASWLRDGIPFSHAPGTGYEYSNYAFMILGRVVQAASGKRYRDYVDATFIRPLGMTSTFWDERAVPPGRFAKGQRREGSSWIEEPALADGAGNAMGGLYSSVADLARWVAFFLDAYPPRDGADDGPLSRASRREMQMPATPYRSAARRATVTQSLSLTAGGYGFGLAVTQSCTFAHIVSHSGGLPGFGSRMTWLPEYGVGIVVLANRTYAATYGPVTAALETLTRTGALRPRAPQPAAALLAARHEVEALYADWDDRTLEAAAASNLLLDRPLAARRSDFAELRNTLGACTANTSDAFEVENALRGAWWLNCARGRARFAITLAPTEPPTIQSLSATAAVQLDPSLTPIVADLAAHIGGHLDRPLIDALSPRADRTQIDRELFAARAWGVCKAAGTVAGDGRLRTTVRLECDHGPLDATLGWDAQKPEIETLSLASPSGEICAP